MDSDGLLAALRPFGQEHLLAFWQQLSPGSRESLARQIQSIDFRLIQKLRRGRIKITFATWLFVPGLRPGFASTLQRTDSRLTTPVRADARRWPAAAQVGVILVAGGQGTRLGFDHPKGMFAIGPVSGRTLFQIHLEKLLATARRFGVRIPLYLMTSPATHEETVEYLNANDRFGLPAQDLLVFCQGTMPAVDAATGRVLLEAPDNLALSPNGHGGMLAAFAESGAMDDAARRGIRELFYFQVDNPLVEIAGAEYVGYHVLSDAEMTTQVIAKRDPLEKVGNVVNVDGRSLVIEYSDLPDDVARLTKADGSLKIWAGSIAVHVFDLGFLRRMAGQLDSQSFDPQSDEFPFHIANKKVSYIDPSGKRVEPAKPNAVKFERFIFDLMPAARNAIVVEVDPATAFAPLKNASGAATDTQESVKAQMVALHKEWLCAAGAEVGDAAVEISPSYALDAEELKGKLRPGMKISGPMYLQ